MFFSLLKTIKFNLFSSIFIIIILIINISIIKSNSNIVVFPLVKKHSSYLSNIKNITDIMENIFLELPIVELNISSQKVGIIISPEEYNIYLTSKEHMSAYEDEKKIIERKYQNINYFDNHKSVSIKYNETMSKSYFYNNFKIWQTVTDNFDDIKLDFVLATSIQYEEPGRLGLQLQEKIATNYFTPSFLTQLKKAGKINNYKWFIYYGKNNEKENDYLVIGCSPHEFTIPETGEKIFQDLNLDEDFHNINDQIFIDTRKMEIIFDDIYTTSNISNLEKDKSLNDFYYKFGFLNTNIGCIIGTFEYRRYLENIFFKDYLYNNKCHNETFKQRDNSVLQTFYYFYCDDSLYKEIKNSFKPLVFKKVDLSENFILNFHDLFLKINGYLAFLVIFRNDFYSNTKWILGSPFLRKYQFVYDFGNKQIGYYYDKNRKEIYDEEENEINNSNNEKNNKFWIYFGYISLIVFLAVLLVVLGFLLGKKVYNIRKKRANELDDDNYDYKKNKIIND